MRLRLLLPALLFCLPASGWTQNAFDCAASDRHRQFDFWVGNWSVSDASGKPLGKNKIRATQKACALEEHWTSAGGGTGQSINYYHPGREEWHQLWTDAGNSIIDIRGGLRRGAMVMEGSIYYLKQSVQKPFRGEWLQLGDGRVRQRFEEQDENGEWQLWFEGFYARE